jgi:adenine-specific DNA-methyltransferase
MITTVINPKGASLGGDFARVEEHIFIVYIGDAEIAPGESDMLNEDTRRSEQRPVKWSSLIRGGAKGIRTDSPGAYYPVFIDRKRKVIHSFGEALPWGVSRESVPVPPGTVAVWPPTHTTGVEGRWGIGPEKAKELYGMGALRLGKIDAAAGKFPLSYLSSGIVQKIQDGDIKVVGRRADGMLQVRYTEGLNLTLPRTVWRAPSHNAGEYGSKIVTQLLPGRGFPFPKSLYAVEDTLRFFLTDLPNAVILDFFGGSGTTAHAVARLNQQDGGSRQCILVTNNEVSEAEAVSLRARGFLPGDTEWEAMGIANHIAIPRLSAAITGRTPDGTPVEGEYKFIDEGPMSAGLDENIEFFELTYEDPDLVSLGRKFQVVAPLLWMKAGARGVRIEEQAPEWSLPDDACYGVLFDTDSWRSFADAVAARKDLGHIFVVTDSEATFQQVISELPAHLNCTQLYADYMRTFEINTKGRV